MQGSHNTGVLINLYETIHFSFLWFSARCCGCNHRHASQALTTCPKISDHIFQSEMPVQIYLNDKSLFKLDENE
jgi:hypothetical protein